MRSSCSAESKSSVETRRFSTIQSDRVAMATYPPVLFSRWAAHAKAILAGEAPSSAASDWITGSIISARCSLNVSRPGRLGDPSDMYPPQTTPTDSKYRRSSVCWNSGCISIWLYTGRSSSATSRSNISMQASVWLDVPISTHLPAFLSLQISAQVSMNASWIYGTASGLRSSPVHPGACTFGQGQWFRYMSI